MKMMLGCRVLIQLMHMILRCGVRAVALHVEADPEIAHDVPVRVNGLLMLARAGMNQIPGRPN